MFDMHGHGRDALGREAIATTVLRIRHHFSAHGVGNGRTGQAQLPVGLPDEDVVATPRQQQPCMRLADKQTTILVEEFLETYGSRGRELASTLAVEQGMSFFLLTLWHGDLARLPQGGVIQGRHVGEDIHFCGGHIVEWG